jgi:hypothetical protein
MVWRLIWRDLCWGRLFVPLPHAGEGEGEGGSVFVKYLRGIHR